MTPSDPTIRVTRLPRDPGPAAWNEILPPVGPVQPLEGTITADWLVIGAGFAGLAAARRLRMTQPGDRIVVLDAVRIGEGPAGRNSGFMIDLPHDLTSSNYGGALERDRGQIEANRAAIEFAIEAAADYSLPEEAIRSVGKINAAATAKGLKHNADYAAHLAALGEAHEHLDAQAMRELTGSDYYHGGLYTPGATMIQPALFVRGVAAGLRANQVRIHERSPVTALARADGVWRVTTTGGCVEAPRVILAVNGHAESFGFFSRRLMHVFTYASMTRGLTSEETRVLGGAPNWGVTPADPSGTTVRRISGMGGDRIVIRNRFTYDPSMEISNSRLTAVARDHDRAFAARFPKLIGVDISYRWGGRLCLARNGAPAFGEVADGLYSACCQNGLGTVRGTFSGIAAADLATGLDSAFVERLSAAPTPSRLPPAPIAEIGAAAVLRWGEWRSGAEL